MTATELPAGRGLATRPRPAFARELAISFRIASRELRSGLQGFRIFLACLILGVAALAAVRSLSTAIETGLVEEGQVILGGDAEFSLIHRRADPDQRAFLNRAGALSEVATLRAMVRATEGEGRALVEVKAVDDAYPLFGAVALEGAPDLPAALARRDGRFGLAVDAILLGRLGAALGDTVRIGEHDFELRAIVEREPDRISDGMMFGPRAFMSAEALAETGLVQPGSLITWRYRTRLAGPSDEQGLRAFLDRARTEQADAGWRIRSRAQAAPGVQRFVDRLTLFLSLVGLTALFVGGVGIANAVSNFLDARRRNIAILKCLGAPGRAVFEIYLFQVLVLAGIGIAVGLAIGAVTPLVLGSALGDVIPLPLETGIYPAPLAAAAAFGLLVTLAFAIWPLARARELPALALFRDVIAPARRLPRPGYIAATAVVLGLLVALALATFEDRQLTAWYVFGLAAGFAVLVGLGHGLKRVVAALPPRSGAIRRLALGNLHRPGAPTVSVVLSLGLGLSLFVALALVDHNITRELETNLPGEAPSFFFLDIQPDQHQRFVAALEGEPGAHDIQSVPMLRGRITEVNGTQASEVKPAPEAEWALRGDRGLTYAEAPPDGSVIVAGEWWPSDYSGEPLVSMTEDIAQGLGLAVGDTMSVNVLGREITARIASLRVVEWRSLAINFVLVFSPSALSRAPHTVLVTVKAPADAEPGLLRRITDAFPNVTAVRVKEALDAVNDLMSKLLLGVRGANVITLLIGVLVLAGALATGMRTRIYDAVVLKTFGAARRQLLAAYALEYGLLGLVTALFAIGAGTAASFAIVTLAMRTEWSFSPAVALSTALLATIVTVAAGLLTTWAALKAKAPPILRNE